MLKTKEQIIEELIAAGKEIAPDDPAQRTAGRRVSSIDGVHCYFSAEEETARDAEEAAVAAEQADYVANHKYIQEADDQLNAVLAVRAAHPKPT